MADFGIEIPGGFFDEAHHVYRNSKGVIIPSTTQVFDLLGFTDFSGVPAETLEWKRLYGTAVHAAVEYLVMGDLDWDSLDEHVIAPVTGVEQWMKKNQYVGEYAEEIKVCSIYGMEFGMTLDHKGKLVHLGKDRSAILDLKTAAKEEATWAWQLGAYSMGQEKTPLGWLGVVLKVGKDGLVKPYYYDLLKAAREFQILLSACILGLNNGMYKLGNGNGTH